jgi:electron transfer flavoprotein beta subunit
MRVLVPVKRVVDPSVVPRLMPDGSGVSFANLKMSINPFCEIAVEAAVRLKESGEADDVLAVSIGVPLCKETVRTALAMGADRGLVIETETALEPLTVAKCLREVVRRENVDLVILGKQAIDDDCNQTGQMLAALLDWPQATQASRISIDANTNTVCVIRETDNGLETVELDLPAVITVDLRLNEPRYASLPAVMKAKKKPIVTLSVNELGVAITPHLEVLEWMTPPQRRAGKKVDSASELLELLRNEARVIQVLR